MGCSYASKKKWAKDGAAREVGRGRDGGSGSMVPGIFRAPAPGCLGLASCGEAFARGPERLGSMGGENEPGEVGHGRRVQVIEASAW